MKKRTISLLLIFGVLGLIPILWELVHQSTVNENRPSTTTAPPSSSDKPQQTAAPSPPVIPESHRTNPRSGIVELSGHETALDRSELRSEIMNSANLADAIALQRNAHGESNALLYAEMDAAIGCPGDPDPASAVAADYPNANDPSRMWAISRWLEQCKNLDKLPKSDARINFLAPSKVAKDKGIDAGLDAAFRVIQTSDEPPELFDAGQTIIENGGLPEAVLSQLDPSLGPSDYVQDWIRAVTLWSCDQGGGCGTNNFITVNFCRNAGCAPGSNFRDGLQATLSARDIQAINSFYSWIASTR